MIEKSNANATNADNKNNANTLNKHDNAKSSDGEILQKIALNIFASLYVAIPLMFLYALFVAIATFIENDYGTPAAKTLIYNTMAFNFLHIWLLLCLIGVIWRYKMFQRKKYASALLHISFIFMIIGAGITRFWGVEGIMNIREGESAAAFVSTENYINLMVVKGEQKFNISLPSDISFASSKNINEKIAFGDDYFILQTSSIEKLNDDKKSALANLQGFIKYHDKSYPFSIVGGEGIGKDSVIDADDIRIFANWGAKMIDLPFEIHLDDFILERYSGSMSPSSFESSVTLIDNERNVNEKIRIYMNNTLDYRGYRFFQSAYDEDEKGTILSVNSDPGKIPTYVGYFLLIISAIFVVFSPNGRFRKLGAFLKTQSIYSLLFVAILGLNVPLYAQDSSKDSTNSANSQIVESLNAFKDSSKEHAKLFGQIQVQGFDGRIKPLDTLSGELVHKITKKNNFQGFSNNQIIIGMTAFPNEWRKVKMIKISTPKLRSIIGVSEDSDYIAFSDLFNDKDEYKLINYTEAANRKKPSMRDEFDKDVLKVNERANIALEIFTGSFLKILPINPFGAMSDDEINKIKDDKTHPMNAVINQLQGGKTWLDPNSFMQFAGMQSAEVIKSMLVNYFDGVSEGIISGDYSKADAAVGVIMDFQKQNSEILISESKLKTEIFLNNTNIFKMLIFPYLLLGILAFVLVLICIFKPNNAILKILRGIYYLLILATILHTIGLALRWYIGGHAPWSNAYESMLYISFVSNLVGILFFSRSYLAVSTASFLAGMSLVVANLADMDPQIGNLVPVLKSYWLNIHVSVITASYAFLGLCFFLGLITLVLFVIRKRVSVDSTIQSIIAINEMSMILGLLFLTIGNFLGGIWANESWGRYWGWDAKEAWSLISIGVYAIIIHLRFITRSNLPYIFSTASVLGFASILMTYFGVNYYLSGLHSYAAGDPVPVPSYLYFLSGAVILLIILAFRNRDLQSVKI